MWLASGLVGLLLLTAAGLKLYGADVSPYARYGWLSDSGVQALAVQWELLLGLWLLSGSGRVAAWAAAVGTFAAFAVVSLYLGWIGQASCGCFGMVKASPWHALAVDVVALVLLAIGRPGWQAIRRPVIGWPSGFAGVLLGAAVLVLSLSTAATWAYGSPPWPGSRAWPCTPLATWTSAPPSRVRWCSGRRSSPTGRPTRFG